MARRLGVLVTSEQERIEIRVEGTSGAANQVKLSQELPRQNFSIFPERNLGFWLLVVAESDVLLESLQALVNVAELGGKHLLKRLIVVSRVLSEESLHKSLLIAAEVVLDVATDSLCESIVIHASVSVPFLL